MNMKTTQNTCRKKLTRAILTVAALAGLMAIKAHRHEQAMSRPTRQEKIERIMWALREDRANEALRQVLEKEAIEGVVSYSHNPYCSIWDSEICATSHEEEEKMKLLDTHLFFEEDLRQIICSSPTATDECLK
jgi:galactose-1-phosphate uridylyltransferase